MTTDKHEHEAGCLMCAVRALTEGKPAIWNPTEAGDSVTGVVLGMGSQVSNFGESPFVDLWQGGHDRIRVVAYGHQLRATIDAAAPMIGDRMTVQFEGEQVISGGYLKGRPVKKFVVTMRRGH